MLDQEKARAHAAGKAAAASAEMEKKVKAEKDAADIKKSVEEGKA